MQRFLIVILLWLTSFLVFASNYSAVDGGNEPFVSIGLWGMMLIPIIFCGMVVVEVIVKLVNTVRGKK